MNNRFLAALSNRSFLFLWLAEVFSQLAMNMMNFLLLFVVFSLTSSNTAVSGIVLSFTVPSIFFAIIAGAYVDRWNKKVVLLWTNLLRAGLLGVLALFHSNLIFLYALTFVTSIVTQFFIPAETPMIPLLVGKNLLLSANALFGLALYGSLFIAYALSGPVLILLGATNGLILLGGLFLAAAASVVCIKLPAKNKAGATGGAVMTIMDEVKETLKLILKIRSLSHAFVLLILVQMLVLIIAVIGPGYAKSILNIPINQFPLLFVTPAVVGMAIGTFILTNFFHNAAKAKSGTVGLFVTAGALILMPYGSQVASRSVVGTINNYLPHLLQITNLHIMVLLAAVVGFASALMLVPSNTIIQEETSDEMRGKIYGALNALTSALSLVPIIVAGSLADIFGVGTVLTVIGILVALAAILRIVLRV